MSVLSDYLTAHMAMYFGIVSILLTTMVALPSAKMSGIQSEVS